MTWLRIWQDKQKQVVLFSSTAIALYGYELWRAVPRYTTDHGPHSYDQGMMSLINTNQDYLKTSMSLHPAHPTRTCYTALDSTNTYASTQ